MFYTLFQAIQGRLKTTTQLEQVAYDRNQLVYAEGTSAAHAGLQTPAALIQVSAFAATGATHGQPVSEGVLAGEVTLEVTTVHNPLAAGDGFDDEALEQLTAERVDGDVQAVLLALHGFESPEAGLGALQFISLERDQEWENYLVHRLSFRAFVAFQLPADAVAKQLQARTTASFSGVSWP